jgi:hypothetical protein
MKFQSEKTIQTKRIIGLALAELSIFLAYRTGRSRQ